MPHYANGKICYLELPAKDVEQSAEFYRRALGWRTRARGDGSIAFDDGAGEVSGTWKRSRAAAAGGPESGILIYIMVDDIDAAMKAIVTHGGTIVQAVGADLPEITARFRDPGGNILGLYQVRTIAAKAGGGGG